MSEVLKSIINYLQLNSPLEIIEASIENENIASIKLVETLGFEIDKNMIIS